MPFLNAPTFNPPHTDTDGRYMSLVYYLNDSDADTFFFDDADCFNSVDDRRVTPKRNRGVMFDAYHKHCASSPKQTRRRLIINSVFKPIEDKYDAITHTILMMLTIYISYKVGTWTSNKSAIQRYTKHLEDQGFVYIERMRDALMSSSNTGKHKETTSKEDIAQLAKDVMTKHVFNTKYTQRQWDRTVDVG